MSLFSFSLLLILLGGVVPLASRLPFSAMKAFGAAGIAAGSTVGLYAAVDLLLAGQTWQATCPGLAVATLSFRIDSLSAFFLMVIFAIAIMAALYSYHYMDETEKSVRTATHYLFFSLLVASMALVVMANDMITFILAWEVMSLSSFFLVVYDYENKDNRRAGIMYLVFSKTGALFILASFGLIYAVTGSFGFDGAGSLSQTVKIVTFALAFIGFGSKAGVFPLHIWLPQAHPAAPSHISALMSGVMIKIGIYGIIRMYIVLDWPSPVFGYIVIGAGMVSGILGVVYALGQHNIKRLLAYHSVENIGIILIGMGMGMIGLAFKNPIVATIGMAGGLLHVLNHALFKSLLFMGAGVVIHKTGTGSIDALGGLIKKMRITGTTFLIGSLAISGLPPFNGFISEFLIYLSGFNGLGWEQGGFTVSLLAIVSLAIIGGLALACFSKVVGVVFQGEPRSAAAEDVDEKGLSMLIPMVILALACAVIGVFPTIFVKLAAAATASLKLGADANLMTPYYELTSLITRTVLIFVAVMAAIVALRSFLYKSKAVTTSGTWGCGFTRPTVKMQYTGSSYAASILEFFKPVAPVIETHSKISGLFPGKTHYHSQMNDIAEMHLSTVVVRPVLSLFDKLRWLQHGDIHLYIGYILLAIVVLLFFV